MAIDSNRSEAAKPPSANSRLRDLEREAVQAAQAFRTLVEGLLNQEPNAQRATLLALNAALAENGRGARGFPLPEKELARRG